MRRKIIYILALLLTSLSAAAINNPQAGGLAQVVGTDTTATTLIVTGEINATDIAFIAQKMTSLDYLDLSAATITACTTAPSITGQTSFPANTLPPYSLMGTTITTIKLPQSLTTIGEGALSATAITAITLPDGLTILGDAAFARCPRLSAITLPASVTNMGRYVFMECEALTTVTLPDGLTTLPDHTFARCGNLKEVTLPATLREIGDGAFAHCTSLATIEIPTSLTTIAGEAFTASALSTFTADACPSLTEIGAWAFARCSSLTAVTLPDGVTTLGDGAFFDCPLLSDYATPTSVTTLPRYMLKGATSTLSETILHDGVTTLGDYSLMGLTQISTFSLPASVDSIGTGAFENWTRLQQLSVENHSTVPALGANVWQNVNQPSAILYVNDDLFDAFSTAPQWQDFKVTRVSSVGTSTPTLGDTQIQLFLTGNLLTVKATSPIAAIWVYDPTGLLLTSATDMGPSLTTHTIDTSTWSARIYLTVVTLHNGTRQTFKTARLN